MAIFGRKQIFDKGTSCSFVGKTFVHLGTNIIDLLQKKMSCTSLVFSISPLVDELADGKASVLI